MSIEPGIVDANVLVYAFDANAPQHSASRTLLDAGRAGTTTLYVTSQALCEFYSIVTNSRRVLKPRTVADAIAAIADLLSFFTCCLFPPARLRDGLPCFAAVPSLVALFSIYSLPPRCWRMGFNAFTRITPATLSASRN